MASVHTYQWLAETFLHRAAGLQLASSELGSRWFIGGSDSHPVGAGFNEGQGPFREDIV
jgi:hypothetical protein